MRVQNKKGVKKILAQVEETQLLSLLAVVIAQLTSTKVVQQRGKRWGKGQ